MMGRIMRQERRTLKIQVIEEDETIWATVAEMPGVFAAGETMTELRDSLEEGIALWLSVEGESGPTVRLGEFRRDARVTETHADLALA
jgi:predicted RNase H-like HicB family nuclease